MRPRGETGTIGASKKMRPAKIGWPRRPEPVKLTVVPTERLSAGDRRSADQNEPPPVVMLRWLSPSRALMTPTRSEA